MRNGRDKRGMAQLNVEVRVEVRERIKEEAEKAGESIGEWLTRRLGYCEVRMVIANRAERVVENSLMAIYGGVDNGPVREVDRESEAQEASNGQGNEQIQQRCLEDVSGKVPDKSRERRKGVVNPAVYGGRDGGVRSASEGIEDIRPAAQAVEQEMPGLVFVRGERDSGSGGHDAGGPLVDYRVLDLDGETVKCCLKCYRVNGEPGGQCKTCRGLNET